MQTGEKSKIGESHPGRIAPSKGVRGSGTPIPRETLEKSLAAARDALLRLQDPKGFWVFHLEADTTIPSEYILMQRFLNRPLAPELKERLANYLRLRQLPDGGWPSYEEGISELSASVKAYFALKMIGDSPSAPHMTRARERILGMGGAARVNVFTRIALAIFGQIPWRTAPAMPIQVMLFPRWFFFHLNKVSYWSRTVIAPLLILYAKRPVCRLKPEEGVQELFLEPPSKLRNLDGFVPGNIRKNLFIPIDRFLKWTGPIVNQALRRKAIERAERFIIERMGEGGLGAIFPAMVNAVLALKVLGYPDNDPHVVRGIKAVDELMVDDGHECFVQPCNSPIWDSGLSLSAIQEAGLPPDHPSVTTAIDWLFDQQVFVRGDWADQAPKLEPGGWAFQFENDFYPDVDDTPKVLIAMISAGILKKDAYRERIARAVNWVIGMQSSDGGWGAFDIDNNRTYLNNIPFADHGALLDPSTSDVTGRCVELLGMLGYRGDFPPVARAIRFLKKEQETFGGWFGRWGVNYIYGTWSVLSALRNVGEDLQQPYIRKAVQWLVSRQNSDGGWGETRMTYFDRSLAGQGPSTASQTAWALLGLMAAGEAEHPAVQAGIHFLIETQNESGGWNEKAFTGTGFPRVFYLRYHGYSLYFPLWALGMYRELTTRNKTRQDEMRLSRPTNLTLPALK